MSKNAILKYILGLLPLFVIGALVVLRSRHKLDFGNIKDAYHTFSYTDIPLKGHSQINRFPTATEILSFEYKLDTGYLYPHCGVVIAPKPPAKFFYLSDYDEVDIEISTSIGKRIPIQLSVYVDGLTNPDSMSPLRYLIYDLDIVKNKRKYNIPLTKFQTPTWWYNINKTTATVLPPPDLDKARGINIINCQLIPLGKWDTVTVHSLAFRKNVWEYWRIYLIICLLYYLLVILYWRKPQRDQILISELKPKISFQEKLEVANIADKDLEKIVSYVGANYHNSELSIPMVQKETGVSESKISTLLKAAFGTSFKQYLTEMRLNEAKRLLLKTDLQVSEIAYTVGFGNVSHFNRVFKAETQQSPSNFRESQSKL